jgi:Methylase involved in ubiquinone/menaquinone biosynthesis
MNFVDHYDNAIFSDHIQQLYEYSDFYNVGYWRESTPDLPDACRNLVRYHATIALAQATPHSLDVLEVACGLGAELGIIREYETVRSCVAINISHKQLRYAATHHPLAIYCGMDACYLGFASESFDRILSIEAAFHFPSRKDFLEEARRVMKPDGILVYTDILFSTTEWVGNWMIPSGNVGVKLDTYAKHCKEADWELLQLTDMTEYTWGGFCRYLSRHESTRDFAERLRASVTAYLLVVFRKKR